MRVTGYTDPMTARPGDTVRVMVSCDAARFRAELVRLVHGDENPAGPGFKEIPRSATFDGIYPGGVWPLYPGSCVIVPHDDALHPSAGFTLAAWIWPTTPTKGLQAIAGKWHDGRGAGYALFINEDGALELRVGDGGSVHRLSTGRPLCAERWYYVAGCYAAATGNAKIVQRPAQFWPGDESAGQTEATLPPGLVLAHDAPFMMAATAATENAGAGERRDFYNGKIEGPRLFGGPLAALREATDSASATAAPDLVAAWNFGRDFARDHIHDDGPGGLHGRAVNMPARAVTGHTWTGRIDDFREAPDEYGAIHFHDDDLVDAEWAPAFSWRIPDGLPSAVYAIRLRALDGEAEDHKTEDHIPIFILPRKGTAASRVAFLAPIMSYLAYANEQLTQVPMALCPNQNPDASKEAYAYAARNRLLSLYERHGDGSGVFYSSRLRPIVNLRPRFVMYATNGPHQFSADLHLIDWLVAKDIAHDILTDEALHDEGEALFAPYRVIVTGTHPEYWSETMLLALRRYLDGGGRLMYLGGNGFYWVTSIDPERPHVFEIRRSDGIRTWESAPGERHHSTTGERGGLWRWRGIPPQSLVGVGFTAQGFDVNAPYRRHEDANAADTAWIFDGVPKDAAIGDHPSLVLKHGAAGFELDRADRTLGTPATARLLASSAGHSDAYQHSVEEVLMSDSRQGGSVNPLVRADMVYIRYPNEGAVFSVGSIAWCGSLSYNAYDNPVSRVTENVLRQFAKDAPLPG